MARLSLACLNLACLGLILVLGLGVVLGLLSPVQLEPLWLLKQLDGHRLDQLVIDRVGKILWVVGLEPPGTELEKNILLSTLTFWGYRFGGKKRVTYVHFGKIL